MLIIQELAWMIAPQTAMMPSREASAGSRRAQRRSRCQGPPRVASTGSPWRKRSRSSARAARLGVAVGRVLLQALQADPLQGPRDQRVEVAGVGRLALEDLDERVQRPLAVEGRPAGQGLEEDGAEAVEVAGGADLAGLAGGLLRGSCSRACRRSRRNGSTRSSALQDLRQAEVADVGLARLVEQDVRGLQVAVDHPLLVEVVDGPGDGRDQPGRPLDRQGRCRESAAPGSARRRIPS